MWESFDRAGRLKPHIVSKGEVTRLPAAAERGLSDASLSALSANARLDLAWRSIIQSALAPMMANGYRPATSEPGHHQLLVQALPQIAGIGNDRVRVLDAYRTLRNRADYRGDQVSDAVASECVAEARSVLQQVQKWLAANRPDLV